MPAPKRPPSHPPPGTLVCPASGWISDSADEKIRDACQEMERRGGCSGGASKGSVSWCRAVSKTGSRVSATGNPPMVGRTAGFEGPCGPPGASEEPSAPQGRLMRHRSALCFGAQQQAFAHIRQPALTEATMGPATAPVNMATSMAARMRRMNSVTSLERTSKAITTGSRDQSRPVPVCPVRACASGTCSSKSRFCLT